MKALAILALSSMGLACHGALAEDLLIRGATVHTVSAKGTLENTDVWVHDGIVSAIGPQATLPAGITVVEGRGKELTPGLFGGLTDIGLQEIEEEPATIDSTLDTKAPAWAQQWRPELDVTQAYNPHSFVVPVTRVEGVTWTVLAPGSGDTIIGGQGAAVTLDGRYDAVLAGSRSLFVQMGGVGARLSGGTRAAQYMLLDQAVREARTAGPVAPGALLHRAGKEALTRYLAGGRVVFQVDRASDILGVLRFAERSGIEPVIAGGDEAWMVAKELAKANVPVIMNPLNDLPVDFDHLGASLENAARLQRAGVRIAFSSGDTPQARLVRQLAGNAVAHGLPWESGLAAITANPAEIFGLGASRGRIAVGQVADLVLWNGDPLEVSTLAEQVWIAGHAIDMHSRQTELRDRYLQKVKAHQAR